MNELLTNALQPILRDIQTLGVQPLEIEDEDWFGHSEWASAMLRSADGTGCGISMLLADSALGQVARVADAVQEWVIEDYWATPFSNWPPCPEHPTTHPLEVRADESKVSWVCPKSGNLVAEVGSLRPAGPAGINMHEM